MAFGVSVGFMVLMIVYWLCCGKRGKKVPSPAPKDKEEEKQKKKNQ